MPEERLRFLADASIMLAGSLDIGETLRELAHAIVPRFADWCTISLRQEDGAVRRIVGVHKDPACAPAMEQYLGSYSPEDHRASAMRNAIGEGRSYFLQQVDATALGAAAQNDEHLQVLRNLGCTSSIIVPLLARGTSVGALSLAMADGTREFTELDHQLARELGALAGLAIDSARRFTDERTARWRAERAEAETRALLAERQQLLIKAESAVRAKDEFLAILGHELRNPLAPIVTALDLMKARGGAPERELAVIERQTRHLVRLVDDLLDVSRIARGFVTLERESVEALEIVEKAIEIAEPLIEQRNHRLSVNVEEGLLLHADATRLAQVIANLLTNAAKYTPAGGKIDVSGELVGARVMLRVRDNGKGIEATMLPHVFDMFVQERQSLERGGGGLGLGLTIVKSLVEAHGGTVTARSEGDGRGSEFEISLPATRMRASAPRIEIDHADTVRPGARVLVVDDNEDAAELMGETLARKGYDTRIANDAQRALEVIATWWPEAAVLDIGLPVVDGYELARQIRRLPGGDKLFLIALTGYGQAMDRERAMAAGFNHHLVKPVDVATIRALLDTALAGSSGIPTPG
jgi:signal transduction histidine kinase/ActR/RegA family two-component response regulator